MKKKRSTPRVLPWLAGLVYFFLWAPVVVMMVFSFSADKLSMRWAGFTTRWYGELLSNVTVQDALKRSLIIALVTVVVATALGTLAAYGLFKLKFRGKQVLRSSILLPIVLPEVVTGGTLLVFFSRIIHLPLGYPSIILAHIVFSTPLAVFVILGRMQRIDWAWEEAALDLGATRFRAFVRVTGPLLVPAIAAAAMLIFPWSFDDFVTTYFVAGVGSTTLPIYVFSQLRFGASPVVNTIGVIFVVVTIATLLVARGFEKRTQRLKV